jgi:succinate dehydrogenase / fumarate reductase cytochrome b subunit
VIVPREQDGQQQRPPQATEKGGLALRPRPLSPNIQVYRPQLTSVLSITNRITGVALSLGAVGLVAWLLAAASGPQAYAAAQGAISSWIGQAALFCFTFAFFLHLCGGIRHLVWDTVHAFDLRSIYLGGWMVVAASAVFTVAAWIGSFFIAG